MLGSFCIENDFVTRGIVAGGGAEGGSGGHVPPSIGVSENFGNLRSVRVTAEFRHLRTEGHE